MCVFDIPEVVDRMFYNEGSSTQKIQVLIDSDCWEYFGNKAYISILGPENSTATLRVTEVKLSDLLGQNKNYSIYNEVYTNFDPNQVSQSERAELSEIC